MTLVYQSTRDANNTTASSNFAGLATDGSFVYHLLARVDLDLDKLKDASYQEVCYLVLLAFLGDFTARGWTTVSTMPTIANLILS